jgi:protease II
MGGATGSPGQLFWFDRSGKQLQAASGPGDFSWHEVSPDGQRVAVQTLDSAAANYQIGVYDLFRGTNMRLTFGPWRNQSPIWSPDSQTIAYGANQKGRNNMLFQRKSDGTGGEQLLTESANNKFPTYWSADGRFIAYNSTPEGKSNSELWILPLFGDRKPFPFLETNSNVAEGAFVRAEGGSLIAQTSQADPRCMLRLFPDTKANGKFPNPEARCLAGGAMGRNSSTSPLTAS